MAKTMKTAISIPKEDYSLMESIRKKMKKSRSQILSEALHAWLQKRHNDIRDAQYEQGYKRHPEDLNEIKSWAKLSAKTMEGENW